MLPIASLLVDAGKAPELVHSPLPDHIYSCLPRPECPLLQWRADSYQQCSHCLFPPVMRCSPLTCREMLTISSQAEIRSASSSRKEFLMTKVNASEFFSVLSVIFFPMLWNNVFFSHLAGEFIVPKQRSVNKVGHGELLSFPTTRHLQIAL